MKKLLPLFLILITGLTFAQSIVVQDTSSNNIEEATHVIEGTPAELGGTEFHLFNSGTDSLTFGVKVKLLCITHDQLSEPLLSVCFGGLCYVASNNLETQTFVGDNFEPTDIAPNGAYTNLKIQPIAGTWQGCDSLTWQVTFYDVDNTADSTTKTFVWKSNEACTGNEGDCLPASNVNEISAAEVNMNFFPNPTTSFAQSQLAYTFDQKVNNASMVITNLLGEEMDRKIITGQSGTVQWDFSDYAAGIYFYSLLSGSNSIVTKKLLVQ